MAQAWHSEMTAIPGAPARRKKRAERFVFTEGRLAALERPAAGTRRVYDAVQRDLAARLSPSNAWYEFSAWHRGEHGHLTIGRVGAIQLRQARATAARYRGELAAGVNVFAKARMAKADKKPATLDGAFKAHVARVAMRPSTRRDYLSLWRLVPSRMKLRAPADIAGEELERLHDAVAAGHPRTANKLLALLSVLFRRAGRRHDNPVAGLERAPEDPRQRVLTIDELHRLRAALEQENEPWRSFFLLLLLTGARRGALQRMQWSDLDLDAATWRIPAVWSKNRRTLTVALCAEAVDILLTLHGRTFNGTQGGVGACHSSRWHRRRGHPRSATHTGHHGCRRWRQRGGDPGRARARLDAVSAIISSLECRNST
jgi:integrase